MSLSLWTTCIPSWRSDAWGSCQPTNSVIVALNSRRSLRPAGNRLAKIVTAWISLFPFGADAVFQDLPRTEVNLDCSVAGLHDTHRSFFRSLWAVMQTCTKSSEGQKGRGLACLQALELDRQVTESERETEREKRVLPDLVVMSAAVLGWSNDLNNPVDMVSQEGACPGAVISAYVVQSLASRDKSDALSWARKAQLTLSFWSAPILGEHMATQWPEGDSLYASLFMEYQPHWPITTQDIVNLVLMKERTLGKFPATVSCVESCSFTPFGLSKTSTNKKHLNLLSFSGHAAIPRSIISLWKNTLEDYFELDAFTHSWDKYCDLHHGCSQQSQNLNWLHELSSEWIFNCQGRRLKGFAHIRQAAEKMFAYVTNGALIHEVDVFICGHPPYACRLLWPLVTRQCKPVLGMLSSMLELSVPETELESWLLDFRAMAVHPLVQFVTHNNLYAKIFRTKTGISIPTACLSGFHLLDEGISYAPGASPDILVWKSSTDGFDASRDFSYLLEALSLDYFGDQHLKFSELRQLRAEGLANYENLYSFHAVVLLLYDPALVTFYEFYHLGMPMFLPDLTLGISMMLSGPVSYNSCDLSVKCHLDEHYKQDMTCPCVLDLDTDWQASRSLQEKMECLKAHSDAYRWSHLVYFSSAADLVQQLHSSVRENQLPSVSAKMKAESLRHILKSSQVWLHAIAMVTMEAA